MIAAEKREKGMERSAARAGQHWIDYATSFVYDYLKTHDKLFVDDLWDAGLMEPASPRALGPVLVYAAREGWMRKQCFGGMTLARPSKRSNLQLKPVWKSNLTK